MKILIDNQDGLGSVDYTSGVQSTPGVKIVRALNKPTTCCFSVTPGPFRWKSPAAGAYVQVQSAQGSVLFTGYVCAAANQQAAGVVSSGALHSIAVEAVSDEIVLDTEMTVSNATLLGGSAVASWNLLAAAATAARLPLVLSSSLQAPSRVQVEPGSRWSTMARVMADTTRSAYSAATGQVVVVPVGTTVHSVSVDDPGLAFSEPTVDALRWIANDITVCGKVEAAAYVTEIFEGDGSTVDFLLTDEPFHPANAQMAAIQDLFQGDTLNAAMWQVADPGSYLSLTAAGLTCSGGTGRDASSVVAGTQELELGGVLTLEAGAVVISAGSSGGFLGLYAGSVESTNCVAGFAVSGSGGAVSVTPMVNGMSVGSVFTPAAGSVNNYRLRLYAPDVERVGQSYVYEADGVTNMLGGNTVPCGGTVAFEAQSLTSGIPGVPVVLYTGQIALLPPSALLGVVDSSALQCSIGSVQCEQTFPAWVTVGLPGAMAAQYVDASTDGGACSLSSAGRLAFYAADVPAAGALIQVLYRSRQVAVARRNLGTAGSASVIAGSLWIGSVSDPAPLSSTDCDNAAAALLAMAAVPATRLRGTYTVVQQESQGDIWPGDVLSFTGAGGAAGSAAVVRSTTLLTGATCPGTVAYTVDFANDAAEELSIRTSSTVPKDAVIPQSPTAVNTALLSLSGATVQSVTASVVTVNTGLTAPVNGGFEVRRRDFTFGPGADSDLVLRTAASTIAIPRSNAVERFYLRMYDGSTPPNYSLHSAAVFLNVPL